MKKKHIMVPIEYLQNDFWAEYGTIETVSITTVSNNPYFNSGDIGYVVLFYDSVKRKNFLFDKHFYLISAPTDSEFPSHLMQLNITKNDYIFSPTSSFNNMKPLTISKSEPLINDIVLGKLLFTFHDFNDCVKFTEIDNTEPTNF